MAFKSSNFGPGFTVPGVPRRELDDMHRAITVLIDGAFESWVNGGDGRAVSGVYTMQVWQRLSELQEQWRTGDISLVELSDLLTTDGVGNFMGDLAGVSARQCKTADRLQWLGHIAYYLAYAANSLTGVIFMVKEAEEKEREEGALPW